MTVNLSLLAGAGWQFFDNNGVPLSGGKLFTYAAGTTTPQVTYTSSSGATANANPIILNAAGRLSGSGEIWLTEGVLYKFVLNDSNNVLIGTYDNISGATDGTSIYAALANSSDPTKGDALVGFRQSNDSGNLTGSVGRTVHQKLQELISPQDFGAAGDGVTNDTAALSAALNSASNQTIDGGGKTFKIFSPIVVNTQNLNIQNMTIDMSSVPAQPGNDFIISFAGTQGAFVNLTADLNADTNVVNVGSTASFSVDQYVWIQSNRLFWAAIPLGQYAKIKSIDSSTQMTLYDNAVYSFAVADVGRIAPVQTKDSFNLNNIKVIGAQANLQAALYFARCADVNIRTCTFTNVDYACIYISRCVNVVVDSVACRYSRASIGLSYGVVFLDGTYNATVVNGYSEDQRHYVATGAATSQGGVNLYVTVANNHIVAARNAGIDAHPPTDYYTVTGNTVEISAQVTGTLDGIICQGLNTSITNNIVVNATRHAIFHQVSPNFGSGSCVIANNIIRNGGGTSLTNAAVNVANQTTAAATIDAVNIANNVMDGDNEFHILVTAVTGNIDNVAITANLARKNATDTSCRVRAQGTGTTVDDVAVTGNVFRSSGAQNLYLLGSASSSVNNAVITGNHILGGINGVRLSYATNVTSTGNYNTGTTRRVFVDVGAGPAWLDRRQSSVVTMTNSTYVVLDQDEYLIANRAGTITMTLPPPATWPGRVLNIKTIQAQAVVSASANVLPVDDSVAGTAILPASDGSWAQLVSDGTNWVIAQRG
jgi:hypothetical protein